MGLFQSGVSEWYQNEISKTRFSQIKFHEKCFDKKKQRKRQPRQGTHATSQQSLVPVELPHNEHRSQHDGSITTKARLS